MKQVLKDKNDILTYIREEDMQEFKKSPWHKMGSGHQFWLDKEKAMVSLGFDEWIVDAPQDTTKQLQYFALLGLDESVMISKEAHNLYVEWEDHS